MADPLLRLLEVEKLGLQENAADTEGWARGVSAWVRTSMRAQDVGRDVAAAVQAARTAGGGSATLVLPSDASWDEGGGVAVPLPNLPPTAPDAIANRSCWWAPGRR